MTQCLVTGGGGFLGQYIVEQLVARGDSVRSLSRMRYQALEDLGVKHIQGDLRNPDAVTRACEGIDVVYHVAAVAGIWGPWHRFHSINTVGTKNVLLGCMQNSVPRLVYSSSPSVTFDGTDQCNVDESAPYPDKWLCHYPHTKALAEQAVLEANSEKLQTCALRPHLIWGPRDQHLIPRLLDRARKRKLRIVGDGSNLVDMVYVENAAMAHVQAGDAMLERDASGNSKVGGKAYFISQGEPVNCWDWINDILRLAKVEPVRKKIPFRVAWAAGYLLECLYKVTRKTEEPRMTRFLAAQLATSHYFDITAARKDFGYEAKISTAEGMQRLAKWCGTG